MIRRTLAVVALTLLAGAVLAAAHVPVCEAAQAPQVTSLSRDSAKVGARLTIRGSHFGVSQGKSSVTFGERRNVLGFAPCSRKARVIRWSSSSITVRAPGMSPGKAGAPGTYHPVYVTVGGRPSNRVRFYIDPVSVNPNIHGATRTYDARTGTTTYTNNSIDGIAIQPMRDVLWDNCVFTNTNPNLPGGEAGVVMLRGAHPRMTFLGCTFTSNTGPGGGSEGNRGVNGFKVWDDVPNGDRDMTFANCKFEAFSRFSFEYVVSMASGVYPTTGTATFGGENVQFRNCDFAPTGAQPLSFAYYNNRTPHKNLIANCTFRGWGNDYPGVDGWGGGCIEWMGGQLEIRDCEIWFGGGPAFNFEGSGGVDMAHMADSSWDAQILMKRVNVDSTRYDPAQVERNPEYAYLLAWGPQRGIHFYDCHYKVSGMKYITGWYEPSTGEGQYLDDCHDIHWTNSTITGGATWMGKNYWYFPKATCSDVTFNGRNIVAVPTRVY